MYASQSSRNSSCVKVSSASLTIIFLLMDFRLASFLTLILDIERLDTPFLCLELSILIFDDLITELT